MTDQADEISAASQEEIAHAGEHTIDQKSGGSEQAVQPESTPAGGSTSGGEPPPSLGVLFVHGLGQQKRGETVPWAGAPLTDWLNSWLHWHARNAKQDGVYVSDT